MSHETPRKMRLMPTSTPMIVSPDMGSSRQIMKTRTSSSVSLSASVVAVTEGRSRRVELCDGGVGDLCGGWR